MLCLEVDLDDDKAELCMNFVATVGIAYKLKQIVIKNFLNSAFDDSTLTNPNARNISYPFLSYHRSHIFPSKSNLTNCTNKLHNFISLRQMHRVPMTDCDNDLCEHYFRLQEGILKSSRRKIMQINFPVSNYE